MADIAKLMSKLVKFVDLIQVDFIKASIFWEKNAQEKIYFEIYITMIGNFIWKMI